MNDAEERNDKRPGEEGLVRLSSDHRTSVILIQEGLPMRSKRSGFLGKFMVE
jgi:hypothetical protein